MSIGERIEAALERTGKKQAELARFLNTKQSTISGWTREGRVPAADRILPICEFLQVSPIWLLTGENELCSDDALVGLLVRMYLDMPVQQRKIVLAQVKAAHDVYGLPNDPARTINQEVSP